jgi:hypothetical protein
MLNYNLNIIEPSKQEKKNEDVRPPIYWSFASFASASDSSDLGELGFATMSINAVNSNCIQISQDASGYFTTDAQFPVTASMTGSNWPITGSTTMSLYTAGITYDPASVNQYYFAAISASALDIFNNPSYTGSKITNSFSASEFFRFYPEGRVFHTKGNIYNPIVNWKTKNVSTINDYTQVNGYSASFSIVKNSNESLASIQEVTGSAQSGSFNNNYALNITASFTANVNNVTGSTTMSFEIPQAGLVQTAKFFNPNTTVAYGTGSFVAISNSPYSITSSLIMNKGNLSTASINWNQIAKSDSQDLENDGNFINGNSSSFNIVKDKNVSVISYPYASASHNGTFSNDYAFNITSSLTASILANTTGSVTMSLIIPEIGFSTSSKFYNETSAGVYIFSASFAATTDSSSYNITGSIINNKGNIWNSKLNFLATGSNYDSYSIYTIPTQFNIFKDVNVNPIVVQQNVNLLAYPLTASKSGILQTQYAYNFESEVTESGTYPIYQVHTFPTTSLIITPAGTSSLRNDSGSIFSYTESPYTSSYNITASAWINKIPSFDVSIIVLGGGGGAGGGSTNPGAGYDVAGGGGGAGGFLQKDFLLVPNVSYDILSIGTGGTGSINGTKSAQNGTETLVKVWLGPLKQNGTASMIAGGGYGGQITFEAPNRYYNQSGGASAGAILYLPETDTVLFGKGSLAGGSGATNDSAGGGGGITGSGFAGNASNTSAGGFNLGGAGGYWSYGGIWYGTASLAPTVYFHSSSFTWTGSGGFGSQTGNGNNATALGGGGGGAFASSSLIGGNGLGGAVILAYSGSSKLNVPTGTITTFSNGVTWHLIKNTGSFSYTYEPKPNPEEQEYQWRTDTLVIAGGGAGGSDEGGGGGAGGYSYNPYTYYELGKTYVVNVGDGQPADTSAASPYSGSDSYIVNSSNGATILFAKGGGEGWAAPGGSGGGASNAGAGGIAIGGFVNQNYYVSSSQTQGFGGGAADPNFSPAGGGGGAANSGSVGGVIEGNGIGGIGKYDLSFTPIGVCGGGNSWGASTTTPNITNFGGGNGTQTDPGTGSAAPANRGGGGGGAKGQGVLSGAGGSGKVQIRYAGTPRATGGQIETQLVSGSYYTLHTFTASGNFIPTR